MSAETKPAPKSADKLGKFFREVRAELKKVNWPDRKELVSSTIIVVISVIVIAAFIGVVDLVFSGLLGYVLK